VRETAVGESREIVMVNRFRTLASGSHIEGTVHNCSWEQYRSRGEDHGEASKMTLFNIVSNVAGGEQRTAPSLV
jgi:hypothetical protein